MINVAIDGPAGAGKSTVAKAAAKALGFIYVDTGALYRTVALAAQRAGVLSDKEGIIALLDKITVELKYIDGVQAVFLDGEDVSALIRTPEISMGASSASAIPEVRAFLLDLQRDIAKRNNVVMDGRDIGTVVLPDAGLKIFLTASAEARARRRYIELQQKGDPATFEEVLADMLVRDKNDSTRDAAPLKAADDAIPVDTTDMTLEESIDFLCGLIRERFGL